MTGFPSRPAPPVDHRVVAVPPTRTAGSAACRPTPSSRCESVSAVSETECDRGASTSARGHVRGSEEWSPWPFVIFGAIVFMLASQSMRARAPTWSPAPIDGCRARCYRHRRAAACRYRTIRSRVDQRSKRAGRVFEKAPRFSGTAGECSVGVDESLALGVFTCEQHTPVDGLAEQVGV